MTLPIHMGLAQHPKKGGRGRSLSHTPLLETPVDQFSLHDTEITQWFAHQDWNYLLSYLDRKSVV